MSDPQPIAGRLFGIETEYGILVEGRGAQDLMEESRLLVRAYPGVWAGPWDYRAEGPRQDMRGFQAERLNYNEEDARLDRGAPWRGMSAEEQRSDRALANGARLYNDHGHPEYSTPECRTLQELVAHDRAGERIVLECGRRRTEETRREVRLFKNNTDFHGISYGCHEGYLTERCVPFERLLHGMLPFLVTRILYAGAGKVGVESGGPLARECPFQLSQRADFFTEVASVDTLARRPIFNTRDEPHADARRYRRLHVICGDANMSEFATALKVGTTCLALGLIEAGWEPLFRLKNPVDAIQRVSRDPSFRWLVELEDGRTIRATDIQRVYLRDAQKLLAGAGPETDWTLREWERVLDDLEADPFRAEDRLDWVAKRKLLEAYIEAENLWWEDEALRSLDLEYHNIDPELGLHAALEQGGQMARVVDDTQIEQAVSRPPRNTRAALRGELVRRFAEAIERVSWGRAALKAETGPRWVEFPAGFGAREQEAHLITCLETVKTASEAAGLIEDFNSPNPSSQETPYAADQG
ncbi:MAG TPA: proteasome accessory factor PafA2 family protein [Armatimonadota bacterium]|nr:proteasome accessory factor PafA2 family protein [Armatimonadota bacterium]